MRKKITIPIPMDEVILATTRNSMNILRAVKKGEFKKLAPRLYTSNVNDTPENIVRRNILRIVGLLYPGAILSHRTSLETSPTKDGQFFVTYKYSRKLRLPGITLQLLEGSTNLKGTSSFLETLRISQRPRAFLENLEPTKIKGKTSVKCLPIETIEQKLNELCRVHGEKYLNQLRDDAKKISKVLKMEKEFKKLNNIVSALLTTGNVRTLKSEEGKARGRGLSYDPTRIERFKMLYSYLKEHEYKDKKRAYKTQKEYETQSFFEAYFSNYIEGTRFPIEQARQIVFESKIPKSRPDAHDILGTYNILVNQREFKTLVKNGSHFLELLKHRHKILMSKHSSSLPGEFKEENNQAGSTLFVEPMAVQGTLLKGLELYELLEEPIKKALYMMFLVAEVHPFADGNGRIARIMMSSILYTKKLEKIIIPNVYREDYVGALKKLTQSGDPDPFVRAMLHCQEFTGSVNFSKYDTALQDLSKYNAFLEPSEGQLKF